jgi:hypothetical protein
VTRRRGSRGDPPRGDARANGEPPDAVDDEEELGFDAIHRSSRRIGTAPASSSRASASTPLGEDDLARLGDSLLVVGDDSLLKVHVHTDDPGPPWRSRQRSG